MSDNKLGGGESSKGMTPSLIHRYLAGDPTAKAALESWRFPNTDTPIRLVTRDQYRKMLIRQGINPDE